MQKHVLLLACALAIPFVACGGDQCCTERDASVRDASERDASERDAGAVPELTPALPDTKNVFCTVTTVKGSPEITLEACLEAGQPVTFTQDDVGKLVTITGAHSNEGGKLTTKISTVVDSTHVVVDDVPDRAMEGISQRVFYGSDQAEMIQKVFEQAAKERRLAVVRAGHYLIGSPLVCPNTLGNSAFGYSTALCSFEPGTIITAMATMAAMITYGSTEWSGRLYYSNISGGMFDGNFKAKYALDIPFFMNLNRSGQTTKNTLHAGIRYGHGAEDDEHSRNSSGVMDRDNSHTRDVENIPIDNITNEIPPVVTTKYDHGFDSGRVVVITDTNVVQATQSFFRITVRGPREFSLDNVDGSGWDAFVQEESKNATVAQTMPSNDIPMRITNITNTDPAVVTTDGAHDYVANDKVMIIGAEYLDDDDDVFTVAKSTSPSSFELQGFAAQDKPPYTEGAWVVRYRDLTQVEAGIYIERANDFDIHGFKGNGFRVGMVAKKGGWDSKVMGHWWNFPKQGILWSAVYLGGEVTLLGAQVDCPAMFGFAFRDDARRVEAIGSHMNCHGFEILHNDLASVFRIGKHTTLQVIGGGAKGEDGHYVLQTLSSPHPYDVNGEKPNYGQIGFQTFCVSKPHPDTSMNASQ